MRIQKEVFICVLALLPALSPPAMATASLSAGTRVCNGYYGLVGSPVPNCVNGDLGGQSGIIIGGSGVGSGINIPLFTNASATHEFSATAAALQDYGVFHAYTAIHSIDQAPDIFGGLYAANAAGEFRDTWVISGGTGQGQLNLEFTISGTALATQFVSGGNGSETVDAQMAVLATLYRPGEASQDASTCCIHSGGTYTLVPGVGTGLTFTFGVPFDLDVLSSVSAGGGFDGSHPPTFYQLDASAAFEHTATLTGIHVADMSGNPIPDFSLAAASGTQYPLTTATAGAVPEPSTLVLASIGAAAFRLAARRNWDLSGGRLRL